MEELIKKVTQKVGISEAQAKSAVDTVVSFLKDKMPGSIGSQVEAFLHGNLGSASNLIDGLKGKAGGLLG